MNFINIKIYFGGCLQYFLLLFYLWLRAAGTARIQQKMISLSLQDHLPEAFHTPAGIRQLTFRDVLTDEDADGSKADLQLSAVAGCFKSVIAAGQHFIRLHGSFFKTAF